MFSEALAKADDRRGQTLRRKLTVPEFVIPTQEGTGTQRNKESEKEGYLNQRKLKSSSTIKSNP